ncbi:uncharacterized protein LOC117651424 [Thrips palmi]|uniref:Uncharacterized protein LOC117651424 n=1 Tax=Thrips palmi TaxID=161013 RepID=A0A6P9A256_THRPL|nr:uncharacterized protein LOC117651424 [Thrips palmi]
MEMMQQASNNQYNCEQDQVASLQKSLWACVAHLPTTRFPYPKCPQYDCTKAEVNSFQNALACKAADDPAAVAACLSIQHCAKILDAETISGVQTCVQSAVAKGL